MPINAYYKGHGQEVMTNMAKEYGAKKDKQVFYATANTRGATPAKKKKRKVRKQRY